jgi:tetratricopeptide (TPR) repeat protein
MATHPLIITSAVQARNSISGYVFDTLRRPVGNLYVELTDDFNSLVARARLSNSGFYAFNNLRAGIYQVTIQTYGSSYLTQTQRIEITTFRREGIPGGSQSLQVDFTLRTKEDSTPKINTPPGSIFAQEVPESARKAYAEAIKTLGSGKNDEQAISELKKAIDIFPSYFMALERLGTEYAKRQQYENAVTILTKAIEVNSRASESLYWLGISQYKLNQSSASIETLRRAVLAAPKSVNARMGLGISLYKDSKYDEAEKQFKQAYKLGGGRVAVVHMHLAQLYSKTERYKEAADELELFLKEGSDARDTEKIKETIINLRKKAK